MPELWGLYTEDNQNLGSSGWLMTFSTPIAALNSVLPEPLVQALTAQTVDDTTAQEIYEQLGIYMVIRLFRISEAHSIREPEDALPLDPVARLESLVVTSFRADAGPS